MLRFLAGFPFIPLSQRIGELAPPFESSEGGESIAPHACLPCGDSETLPCIFNSREVEKGRVSLIRWSFDQLLCLCLTLIFFFP